MDTKKPATARGPGRPKGSTGDVYHQLAQERVRHEKAKADACELANRLRSGELLEAAEVGTALTRMHFALAQQIRAIPDLLERKFALNGEVCAEIEDAINAALEEAGEVLQKLGSTIDVS
ncbi:MAG: hypothetical protein Q8M09_20640 [Pseudomonadota bacterium]|nr:hypothetical protein [Pseudomonadota bacterium]MDP2351684.1 hypothetical protein [Pseudomonadota bacterium]